MTTRGSRAAESRGTMQLRRSTRSERRRWHAAVPKQAMTEKVGETLKAGDQMQKDAQKRQATGEMLRTTEELRKTRTMMMEFATPKIVMTELTQELIAADFVTMVELARPRIVIMEFVTRELSVVKLVKLKK